MLNTEEKIDINIPISFTVIQKIYYSHQTKRGFYKIYDDRAGLYYGLKTFDLEENDIKDIQTETIVYNKAESKTLRLPKIHHSFKKDGLMCLIMDWIDGKNTNDVFKNKPKDNFELKQRIEFCIEISKSVESIHKSNLIHRDLKPENILLLNPKSPKDSVSIIDFGLSASKRSTQGEGTPAYQSPEQEYVLGAIGTWTDIYSLGQVIYFLLHSETLPLYANDDYDDWVDIKPQPLNSTFDEDLYLRIFKNTLAFNYKNRYRINNLISELKNLKRSIK